MSNVRTSIAMGLDAIFSANHKEQQNIKIHEKTDNISSQVPVADIKPSPFQARKMFSESSLIELATSIEQHGLLQPLIVRKNQNEQYELLAGERRLRAVQLLGFLHVSVIECSVDNQTAMAFGLIENIQRENLNAMEEAEAYQRLLYEFKLSHDELAEKIGKSRSHITNMLRLNNVSTVVKKHLIDSDITMGHARALLSLNEHQQIELIKIIIHQGLSVRQTEAFVKKITNNSFSQEKNAPFILNQELKENIFSWKKQLKEKYAVEIKINFNAEGRGRVVLEVESPIALSTLISQLT